MSMGSEDPEYLEWLSENGYEEDDELSADDQADADAFFAGEQDDPDREDIDNGDGTGTWYDT